MHFTVKEEGVSQYECVSDCKNVCVKKKPKENKIIKMRKTLLTTYCHFYH